MVRVFLHLKLCKLATYIAYMVVANIERRRIAMEAENGERTEKMTTLQTVQYVCAMCVAG